MASIELTRSHSLSSDDARRAVERVAAKLESKLDVTHEWKGDTLHFEGSGADGRIEVGADEVRVAINLGLMLRPMKGWIRTQAARYLDEQLA